MVARRGASRPEGPSNGALRNAACGGRAMLTKATVTRTRGTSHPSHRPGRLGVAGHPDAVVRKRPPSAALPSSNASYSSWNGDASREARDGNSSRGIATARSDGTMNAPASESRPLVRDTLRASMRAPAVQASSLPASRNPSHAMFGDVVPGNNDTARPESSAQQ